MLVLSCFSVPPSRACYEAILLACLVGFTYASGQRTQVLHSPSLSRSFTHTHHRHWQCAVQGRPRRGRGAALAGGAAGSAARATHLGGAAAAGGGGPALLHPGAGRRDRQRQDYAAAAVPACGWPCAGAALLSVPACSPCRDTSQPGHTLGPRVLAATRHMCAEARWCSCRCSCWRPASLRRRAALPPCVLSLPNPNVTVCGWLRVLAAHTQGTLLHCFVLL